MASTETDDVEPRRGVVVLGMHRSGTSAVTRALGLLGGELPPAADLMPPSADNPTGYWESLSLTAVNDELLAALGGTWSAPPKLAEGWQRDARIEPLRVRALQKMREVFRRPTWVWKDPRTCVTLPFWLDALKGRPVAVVVLRNPLEIWRSLESRDGLPKPLSLALWERYMRETLRHVRGLPVLVTRYADLLQNPGNWCRETESHLRSWGALGERWADDETIAAGLRKDLRHAEYDSAGMTADVTTSAPQRALFAALEGAVGAHASFEPPALGEETSSSEAVFEVWRFAEARLAAQLRRISSLEHESRELMRRLDEWFAQEKRLHAEHERLRAELGRLRDEHRGDVARMRELQGVIEDLEGRLAILGKDRDQWRAHAEATQRLLSEIHESPPWRMVERYRSLRTAARRVLRGD